MDNFSIKTALEWFGAIVVALGGTGAIIIALAKWFGDRLANKLLEKDKARYQQELEGLKRQYQEEIETKKTELEKSKTLFFRYSEHQFSLYNELWKNLCDLKHTGELLWEKAEVKTIKDFSKQLKTTKLSVEKSALLIENAHYKELLNTLKALENFEVGKKRLIELRNMRAEELGMYGINEGTIRNAIVFNGKIKNEYTNLLEKLSHSFKQQIKGEPLSLTTGITTNQLTKEIPNAN